MSMRIILAGYNIDTSVMNELLDKHPREDATPETISAAYARISRNPKPVDQLRQLARQEVSRSRESNRTIIFEMGHHSVAEHAVFNFDVIDISRLALEELEHFRLCSFTEKSQRYITLKESVFMPAELVSSGLASDYLEMCRELQLCYRRLFDGLFEFHLANDSSGRSDKERKRDARLKANEDARYILPLAMPGQVGMTINARNLEFMIRRCKAHHRSEIRSLGELLHQAVIAVVPSLLLFTSPTAYDRLVHDELRICARNFDLLEAEPGGNTVNETASVLLTTECNADELLLSSILHRIGLISFHTCQQKIQSLGLKERRELILTAFRHVELYDAVLREFEFINLQWELVVSASCFAQLKRHRMASISAQDYNPALGVTCPPLIREAQLADTFLTTIATTDIFFSRVLEQVPPAAAYVLTNAHRRRVHFSCNARELYHFCRLREDEHAQWDIRSLASIMHEQAEEIMPLTTMFLCGKDNYPAVYQAAFGHPPLVAKSKLPGTRERSEPLPNAAEK